MRSPKVMRAGTGNKISFYLALRNYWMAPNSYMQKPHLSVIGLQVNNWYFIGGKVRGYKLSQFREFFGRSWKFIFAKL